MKFQLAAAGLSSAILAGSVFVPPMPIVQALDQDTSALAPGVPATGTLPDQGMIARGVVFERSLFAPDRRAFTRAPEIAAPAHTPVMRLVGIHRSRAGLRALLVLDGVELTVGEGDETALGRVSELSSDGLVIGQTRLGLFDQEPTDI